MRLSSHHFIFAAYVFCFTENQGPKKKQIIISEKRSKQKSFKFEKLKRKEAGTEVFLTFVPRFFFFEISEKPDFWTPFIRESVANLIFRFVSHSFL